jgi:hypothetical protein
MLVDSAMLQTTLMLLLSEGHIDNRLGGGEHYLSEALRQKLGPENRPTKSQIMSTVWSLIGQGLAYIDYSQSSPSNWSLYLTESGIAAANDESINPNMPGAYLERLSENIPGMSDAVRQYVIEAVGSYTSRLYLANSVMLGVASEGAFLEMASTFGKWLQGKEQEKFLKIIEDPKINYIQKFLEFRKRIEPHKPDLPSELADNMALSFDAVLDLLRINRNDAGHPTGKMISRDDAFTNLQIFARLLQKIYLLKDYFEGQEPE